MKQFNSLYNKQDNKKSFKNQNNKKIKVNSIHSNEQNIKYVSSPIVQIDKNKKPLYDKQNYNKIQGRNHKKKTNLLKDKKVQRKYFNQQQIKQPRLSLTNPLQKKQKIDQRIINPIEQLKHPSLNKIKNSNGQGAKFEKSIKYNRYLNRRKQWQNQRQLSVSLKKRSLSKQFNKVLSLLNDKLYKTRPSSVKNQYNSQGIKNYENLQFLNQILVDRKKHQTSMHKSKKQISLIEQKNKIYKHKSKKQKLKKKNSQLKSKIFISHNPTLTSSNQKFFSSSTLNKNKLNNKKIIPSILRQKSSINIQSQSVQQEIIQQNVEIEDVLLTKADEFNLNQLRLFQSTKNSIVEVTKIQKSSQYLNEMASKIQRYWRRYNTRKIIKLYVNKMNKTQNNRVKKIVSTQIFEDNSQSSQYSKNIDQKEYQKPNNYIKQQTPDIKSQNLRDRKQKQYINEDQIIINKYTDVVNQIKQEQISKWNQMISLIHTIMKGNIKQDTQKLLLKLAEKSQINKQNLQKIPKMQQDKTKRQSMLDYYSEQLNHEYLIRQNNNFEIQNQIEPIQVFKLQHDDIPYKIKKNNFNKTMPLQRYQTFHQNYQPQCQTIQNQLLFKHKYTNYNKIQSPIKMSQNFNVQNQLKQKIKQSLSQQQLFTNQNSIILSQQLSLTKQPQISTCLIPSNNGRADNIVTIIQNKQQQWKELQQLISSQPFLQFNQDIGQQQIQNQLIVVNNKIQPNNIVFDKSVEKMNQAKIKQKQQRQKIKSRGIQTDITFIALYLQQLIQYIIQNQIDIQKQLHSGYSQTANQILKYYHQLNQSALQSEQSQTFGLLSYQIFQQNWRIFQTKLVFDIFFTDQPIKQQNRQHYLKYLTKIHSKALFDTFHQSLIYHKNFDYFTKSLPWKNTPNFLHTINQQTKRISLKDAYIRTIQIARNQCGKISDNEQIVNKKIFKEDKNEQQDDKTSHMLALELMEEQQMWLIYNDQQAEILLEISDFGYEYIVNDFINEIYKLL